jgi:hypothetical protein
MIRSSQYSHELANNNSQSKEDTEDGREGVLRDDSFHGKPRVWTEPLELPEYIEFRELTPIE